MYLVDDFIRRRNVLVAAAKEAKGREHRMNEQKDGFPKLGFLNVRSSKTLALI